ncbi:MAG: glycosyltransferase family 39 protein [Verrucomicrobiota bacterium]
MAHRGGVWHPSLWVALLVGSLLSLPFVLALGAGNSLSHDEHQHIAAGVLFSRDGLLPYRDFSYFHLPYLVYLYGLLFQFSDHYLLVSRLFSVLCAALTGGTIFAAAWRLFPQRTMGQRLAIGIAGIGVLLSTPVFYDTVGHSWNQEPSVLLALLGFLCHYNALEQKQPGKRLFLSGILIGLAIGIRVTFAPLVLPFAVMLWLRGPSARERWRQLLSFGSGIALALLPAAWACFSGPAGFVFGNVEFPKVNIEYRFATGEPRTMTLATKLRFFFKLVMRPNWVLFHGFLIVALTVWFRSRVPFFALPRLFLFLLLTIPFLLLGGLAPSPSFDQYFYPLAPFLVVGILSLFAVIPPGVSWSLWMWRVAASLAIFSVIFAGRRYHDLGKLLQPQLWNPSRLHLEATQLRRLVPTGRVLTLAPTLPLEAGLQIHPEFTTGPFAWRVAPYVAKDRHALLRILAAENLTKRMEDDPPAAVLLGFEKRWEEPLARYARSHGYILTPFLEDRQLWVAPPKEPDPQKGQ